MVVVPRRVALRRAVLKRVVLGRVVPRKVVAPRAKLDPQGLIPRQVMMLPPMVAPLEVHPPERQALLLAEHQQELPEVPGQQERLAACQKVSHQEWPPAQRSSSLWLRVAAAKHHLQALRLDLHQQLFMCQLQHQLRLPARRHWHKISPSWQLREQLHISMSRSGLST